MPLVIGLAGAAYGRTACRILTGHWASMNGGPGVEDGATGETGGWGMIVQQVWDGMAWHGTGGVVYPGVNADWTHPGSHAPFSC